MRAVSTAGGGFLLAVLWFDLMFDVQVLGQGSGLLADATLASISAYYARVTTGSWPMGSLLVIVMLVTIASVAYRIYAGRVPGWFAGASLFLVGAPVLLALGRILPNAARLGARTDAIGVQSDLARSICYDHVFCFVCIGVFLALQLGVLGGLEEE